ERVMNFVLYRINLGGLRRFTKLHKLLDKRSRVELCLLRSMLLSLLSIGIKTKQIGNRSTKISILAINQAKLQIARLAPAIDIRLGSIRNQLLNFLQHILV